MIRKSNSFVLLLPAFLLIGFLFVPDSAQGQFVSGSDGSDGAFNPLSDVTIDLSQAGGGPGTGTYDPTNWSVVFNYTTVDIPTGVTVNFENHPSGAPVILLATGNVNIGGTVDVSANGTDPGPGGFAGGTYSSSPTTGGLGPGGGRPGGPGSYGSLGGGPLQGAVYGHPAILPLIGGSGGGAYSGNPGGPGGGAILLASSSTIAFTDSSSAILARGGYGGSLFGSGGAIRLIANEVTGPGVLDHRRADLNSFAGLGRIRVEAATVDLPFVIPSSTITFDNDMGPVFPDASTPHLRIVTVAGEPFPADPNAEIYPDGTYTVDLTTEATMPVTVEIEANYVPTGTTVEVFVQGTSVATSTPLAGTLALSTATASISYPDLAGSEIYLRANW